MFGAFDSPHNGPIERLTGERLHTLGVTDKADPVTLIDCIVAQQANMVNVGSSARSNLHVYFAFWGARLDAEEVCFSGMTFAVEGLDEWFVFHHRSLSHDMVSTGRISIT